MEKILLKIFQLADLLNEKQDKVDAEIHYSADSRKKLEIAIKSKKDFSYIENCEIQLVNNSLVKLDSISKVFEIYLGGAINE